MNAANQLRAAGNLQPVGFLDDDPKKTGLLVAGLKVLGPVSLLSSLVPKYRVEQVILCIPSPPRELLRRIWAASELLGVNVKIVPTLEEILGRKINTPNFRNIEMNDLLGRKPVEKSAHNPAMVAAYAGKRILITGAGGSIGSELALQLSKAGPAALLLLDKDCAPVAGRGEPYCPCRRSWPHTGTRVVVSGICIGSDIAETSVYRSPILSLASRSATEPGLRLAPAPGSAWSEESSR